MKVLLNADWLKGDRKAKLHWMSEVREEFSLNFAFSKKLADVFFDKTENLTKGVELLIDTDDFHFLKNYDFPYYWNKVYETNTRSIKNHLTEEDKLDIERSMDPSWRTRRGLADGIEKLLNLVPEDRRDEASGVLDDILDLKASMRSPYASA